MCAHLSFIPPIRLSFLATNLQPHISSSFPFAHAHEFFFETTKSLTSQIHPNSLFPSFLLYNVNATPTTRFKNTILHRSSQSNFNIRLLLFNSCFGITLDILCQSLIFFPLDIFLNPRSLQIDFLSQIRQKSINSLPRFGP